MADNPPRFFAAALPPPGDHAAAPVDVSLDTEEAHHARTVLRLRADAPVELFDGQGHRAAAALAALDRLAAAVRVVRVTHTPPPRPRLDVAVAPPKAGRLDDLVDQLTQLGVDHVILTHTARATVEPRPAKLDRLRRVALAAARQCRRDHLPHLYGPLPFADVLQWSGPDQRLIADPTGDITAPAASAGHVLVLVGPEGGFTTDELDAAAAAGFRRWRFAPHVLRIETAAAAAAATIRALALR